MLIYRYLNLITLNALFYQNLNSSQMLKKYAYNVIELH